jgi:hypothetical protein
VSSASAERRVLVLLHGPGAPACPPPSPARATGRSGCRGCGTHRRGAP